ncbi:MAG TPA: triose-phosphate isomerase [Sphingobium sp.]|uniref:triose-phosphate isomerase n=1 Tax=Sphingobium sp. TaxID=1912891 RepID=UPI002ED4C223
MADRRPLIAGNWKMNGLKANLGEITAIAAEAAASPAVDVALFIPATLIAPAVAAAPDFFIGGQDVHENASGAHTGCISAAMLVEAGAKGVIVGHSERRTDQHETDATVAAKASRAKTEGLSVILCVGESLEVRDAGNAEEVVSAQLLASLPQEASSDWLSIAYEPIWAIGTGRVPTIEAISEMHSALRAALRKMIGGDADKMRILYGGSVSGDNARDILSVADVDGGLVGGASLTAAKFVPIIEAARNA